jgi:hypothetical protein
MKAVCAARYGTWYDYSWGVLCATSKDGVYDWYIPRPAWIALCQRAGGEFEEVPLGGYLCVWPA